MGAPRIERLDVNGIINAGMDRWERVLGATTTVNTATPTSGYTADRFRYGTTGTTVKNFSVLRSTDIPSAAQVGERLNYSYQFNCLTAITSPASGDVVVPIQYLMEGQDYAKYHGKLATFGFWIKVTSTATFPINVPVAFSAPQVTRCYVTTVSVTANNTWQFVTFNLTFESAGAFAFDNSAALKITVGAGAVGSANLAASANTWVAGDSFSVSGAFNSMGVNTNVIRVTGFGIYEGAVSPQGNFIRAGRSLHGDFLLCKRYCEVWSGLSAGQGVGNGAYVTTTNGRILLPFTVAKRAFPSVSFTNLTSFRMNNASVNNRVISISSIQSNLNNSMMILAGSATTNGAAISDLDCDNANGAGVIVVDAEL
jgi:hypothetical protein